MGFNDMSTGQVHMNESGVKVKTSTPLHRTSHCRSLCRQ